MALAVVDRAMQSFGAEGLSQDTELASRWAGLRTLRLADVCSVTIPLPPSLTYMYQGPDAVCILSHISYLIYLLYLLRSIFSKLGSGS